MPADFNPNIHSAGKLPRGSVLEGTLNGQPVRIVLANDVRVFVGVDGPRQALMEIRSRLIDTDANAADAQVQLTSLAAAKLVVAPTGDTTAGNGSGDGRALGGQGLIAILDNDVDAVTVYADVAALDAISPIATTDNIPVWDISEAAWRKATVADVTGTGGFVVGPASATDNAVVRFDLATGKLVKNSGVLINNSNVLTAEVLIADDTSASNSVNALLISRNRRSGGGGGSGLGIDWTASLDNSLNSLTQAFSVRTMWVSGTDSAEFSQVLFNVRTNGSSIALLTLKNSTVIIADSATYPPLNITERSSAPTTPASNDLYVDDGSNTGNGLPGWRRWTGAAWEDLGGADHASTHNTGGTDALTALSAAILTSGIIPDARMPDLTGDVTTSEGAVATTLATKLRTHSRIIYIESPTASDVFPVTYVPDTATVIAIRGVTDTGTVTFNIEKRGKFTPATTGTDVLNTDMVADATGEEETDAADMSEAVSADNWLVYVASAVASSPTKLWVVIEWTID